MTVMKDVGNYWVGAIYDPVGEMIEEDHYTSTGQVTGYVDYGYDKNGNRQYRSAYDPHNNYLQGESLTYDAGNQLTQINHYVQNGVLSSTDPHDYFTSGQIDGNGNQLVSTGGGQYSYAYHPDNRLKSITGSGLNETSYYYPDGRPAERGGMQYMYAGSQRLNDANTNQTQTHASGARC